MFHVCVITISDRCSSGTTVDESGPAIQAFLLRTLAENDSSKITFTTHLLPDNLELIQSTIKNVCDAIVQPFIA